MLNLSGEQKRHLKLVLDVAIGVGPGRPALSTVSVEVGAGLVTFVTADGFRLAAMRFRDEAEGTFTINVDAKALKKLLPGGKKSVELSVSNLGVTVDGVHSVTPVEVTYPGWRAVLPKADEPSAVDACFQWPYAETLIELCGEEDRLDHTGYLRQSIHDEDTVDEYGATSWSSHVWAWSRGGVSYLYCLMPVHVHSGGGEISFDSLEVWRGQGDVPEASEGVSEGEGAG